MKEKTPALDAAASKVHVARQSLERARLALNKSTKHEAHTLGVVNQCKGALEAAESRETHSVSAMALNNAEVDHSLAVKDLKAKQAFYDGVLAEVNKASSAVDLEIQRIVLAEALSLAVQLELHLDKANALADKLRGYLRDPMHTPVNELHAMPPAIERALNRVPTAQAGIHTPRQPGGMSGPNRGALLAKRRSELMASVFLIDQPLVAA